MVHMIIINIPMVNHDIFYDHNTQFLSCLLIIYIIVREFFYDYRIGLIFVSGSLVVVHKFLKQCFGLWFKIRLQVPEKKTNKNTCGTPKLGVWFI